MPPSGFDKQSITPLLEMIKDFYETVNSVSGEELDKLASLESDLRTGSDKLPMLMLSHKGVRALQLFFAEILQDIQDEIEVGKKIEGEAIDKEISDIANFLDKFTIEETTVSS